MEQGRSERIGGWVYQRCTVSKISKIGSACCHLWRYHGNQAVPLRRTGTGPAGCRPGSGGGRGTPLSPSRLLRLLSWRLVSEVVVGWRRLRLLRPAGRTGKEIALGRCPEVHVQQQQSASDAKQLAPHYSLPGGCGHRAQLGRWGALALRPRVGVGWCRHKHRALQSGESAMD